MGPTAALQARLGALLAGDTTTLAQASDANVIALVQSNTTYSPTLVAADLELADFDGSTEIAGATGAQLSGTDPATGDQIVTIKEPAGGWRWETTGVTNLPQTIYGFALLNEAKTTLYGYERLATPVTLTAADQVIDIGSATFRIIAGAMQ